jgi:hypothetical protein
MYGAPKNRAHGDARSANNGINPESYEMRPTSTAGTNAAFQPEHHHEIPPMVSWHARIRDTGLAKWTLL